MDEVSNSVISRSVGVDVSPSVLPPSLLLSRGVNSMWSFTRHGRKFFAKGLSADHMGDLRAMMMLRKEFDLAVRLDHPAIVRTLALESLPEAGECIVMEWIEGLTLGKWLESGPPSADRVRVAREICDALTYAAESGVCHRDLKPDNIMITRIGQRVKIIDFGMGDSDDYALLKQAAGTRSFGAPEQQEDPVECGPEADVYSFGRILEFMGLAVRYRHVIRRCLRIDPAERPDMSTVSRMMRRVDTMVRNIPLVAVSLLALFSVAFGVMAIVSRQTAGVQASALMGSDVPRDTVYLPAPQQLETDTLYNIGEKPGSVTEAPGLNVGVNDMRETTVQDQGVETDRFPKATDVASDAYDRAVAKVNALSEKYKNAFKTDDAQKKVELALQFNDETAAIVRQFETELKNAGERSLDISNYSNSLYVYITKIHPANS